VMACRGESHQAQPAAGPVLYAGAGAISPGTRAG
jgi:hypothetical protein